MAAINPLKAIVEPMDRSMPPVRMTSVTPSAAMAMSALLRRMLKMLSGVRNALLLCDSTSPSTISTSAMLVSGRWMIRRKREGCGAIGFAPLPSTATFVLIVQPLGV
jgi:hypothetical protein